MSPPAHVTITTGARLHFGLLAPRPGDGRQFGGAGLMVDEPGFVLSAEPAPQFAVDGPEPSRRRCEEFVRTYLHRCPAGVRPPPCRLRILREIPPHSGLGSGTQLGMAVAGCLSRLAGEVEAPPEELARRVGRGARSALGVHGFARGGFLVDGGKRSAGEVGVLLARAEFPADWRLLLATPAEAPGLSGSAERDAFSQLAPMPPETTGRLSRILLMQLLPAVLEADFETCGDALYEFGRLVGEYFAPAQQGTYASPAGARLVARLRAEGVRGAGQTSWGPTIFALCDGAASAEDLAAKLASAPEGRECRLRVVAALNQGAAIEGC